MEKIYWVIFCTSW